MCKYASIWMLKYITRKPKLFLDQNSEKNSSIQKTRRLDLQTWIFFHYLYYTVKVSFLARDREREFFLVWLFITIILVYVRNKQTHQERNFHCNSLPTKFGWGHKAIISFFKLLMDSANSDRIRIKLRTQLTSN